MAKKKATKKKGGAKKSAAPPPSLDCPINIVEEWNELEDAVDDLELMEKLKAKLTDTRLRQMLRVVED